MEVVHRPIFDGGRAYLRLLGDTSIPVRTYKVKDGQFKETK